MLWVGGGLSLPGVELSRNMALAQGVLRIRSAPVCGDAARIQAHLG